MVDSPAVIVSDLVKADDSVAPLSSRNLRGRTRIQLKPSDVP